MIESVVAEVLRVSVAIVLLRVGGVLSEELARALWLRKIGIRVVVLLLMDLEDVAVVLAHDLRYLLVDLLTVGLWSLAPLTRLKEVVRVLTLEPAVPRWPVESRIALIEGAKCSVHLHRVYHQVLATRVFKMVSLLVRVQVRLLVKSLVASGVSAGKGFLPRVDPQVSLQVEVKRESFSTLEALIRFFALKYKFRLAIK